MSGMNDRYRRNREYLERAAKVTPGAAQTLSKMPARFPQGAFPVALERGKGARVWDVDGNEYVDWICGLGAMTLGYSNELFVGNMVIHGHSASFSLPYYKEAKLAERLCAEIPCAEMVRFVNSGSEATEAAIRTARIWKQQQTGNDKHIGCILTVGEGYHGWHSWFQACKPWHPGVPWPYETMIGTFQYNDLDSVQKAFESDVPDAVAAVILEPCLFEPPAEGFLQGVRDLYTKHGALLIFDEMVTGYRWALAGGQEYFGVTPDLATFGKGMANGFPIGMLCGKREYMQHAELISGTFGGNAVSLAAANAVLDVYEREPVIKTMGARGAELQSFFTTNAKAHGVPSVCSGYPCKPRIRFIPEATGGYFYTGPPDAMIDELFVKAMEGQRAQCMSLFLQVTAWHGVLFHPGGFNVSAALTDVDMERTYAAIDAGMAALAHSLHSGDWSQLTGQLCKPVVTVRE